MVLVSHHVVCHANPARNSGLIFCKGNDAILPVSSLKPGFFVSYSFSAAQYGVFGYQKTLSKHARYTEITAILKKDMINWLNSIRIRHIWSWSYEKRAVGNQIMQWHRQLELFSCAKGTKCSELHIHFICFKIWTRPIVALLSGKLRDVLLLLACFTYHYGTDL